MHDDRAGLVRQAVEDFLRTRDVAEALGVEEQQRHHEDERA
ncbi:MAG TPA: hypothetical protein VGG16_01720 [Streptosporangiaceae bacterium]